MDAIIPSGPVPGLAKEAVDAAASFLNRLIGPAADEIAGYFGDRTRLWRFERALKLADRARRKAKEAGREIQPVSEAILFPILSGAVLEAEESPLFESWANLLGNAAINPRDDQKRFADILRQLTADYAMLFQSIAAPNGCVAPPGTVLDDRIVAARSETFVRQEVGYWIDQMTSLGLVRPVYGVTQGFTAEPPVRDTRAGTGMAPGDWTVEPRSIELSDLGARFLAAVQVPRPARVKSPIWTGLVVFEDRIDMQAEVGIDSTGTWRGAGLSYSVWIAGEVRTNIGRLNILGEARCYPYEYEFIGVGAPQGPLSQAVRAAGPNVG